LLGVVRLSKLFLVAGSILLVFSSFMRSSRAQESSNSTVQNGSLPDAPQPAQIPSSSGSHTQHPGAGNISGTVLDANQDVLQSARVTLAGPSGFPIRSVESGKDGQFALAELPPGVYTLTVTAPDMNTFTSARISLLVSTTLFFEKVSL
jgi:hypothetical protein